MQAQPTWYEALGGRGAVAALVRELYLRVLADATVAAYFAHANVEQLESHQAAFLTEALAGPAAYEGRSMREAHAGRGITDKAFDRLLAHLVEALAAINAREELVQAVVANLEPLRSEIVESPITASIRNQATDRQPPAGDE